MARPPLMTTPYAIGIDVGSTAVKVVVLDACDGALLHTLLEPTGFSSVEAARRVGASLMLRGIDVSAPGVAVVATGYGRETVSYAARTVTEITCHAQGAARLFGADGVVIDVGGQDTKVIELVSGKVNRFVMNEKCAAGTGKFLEIMADRLAVSQLELAALARTGRPITISSMCTVFAESEVIALIGGGTPRADIAYGVIGSVVDRVAALARGMQQARDFLTGGLCENAYVVEQLAARLGRPVETCAEARYAGALGAALCALDDIRQADAADTACSAAPNCLSGRV
jgi:(R)-2-hydroxyacyl-CoA dehydratese activating ATPase